MLECANTENCRQAKIIDVGSKDIVFDKTAIVLHMLEDPGIYRELVIHHLYVYLHVFFYTMASLCLPLDSNGITGHGCGKS